MHETKIYETGNVMEGAKKDARKTLSRVSLANVYAIGSCNNGDLQPRELGSSVGVSIHIIEQV